MIESKSVVASVQGQKEEWNVKRHEKSFEDNRSTLYFNFSGGFTGIYNCQNSWNYTLSCTDTQKRDSKAVSGFIKRILK